MDAGDVLRYRLLTAPAFLSIDSVSGLISGTPGNADVGAHDVSVQVRDQAGATDQQDYRLTVENENDPPVVSDIPDQTVAEGQSFASIALDDYVTDPDNGDNELNWTYSGNKALTVKIDENRVATVSAPDENWNGSETITFTVTDPGGLPDSDAAVFTVTAVNDTPRITSTPDTTAIQDQLYQYQVTATDADEGAVLRYSLLKAPSFLSIDSVSGLISGTPGNADVGVHDVSVQVHDQAGATDRQDYRLTVENQNDPPVFTDPLPELSFKEDDSLFVPFEYWYPYIEDVDNPDSTLIFTMFEGRDSVRVRAENLGHLIYAPDNWFGRDTLQLVGSDGSLSDTGQVIVSVHSVNDAPQIVGFPDSLVLLNTDTLVVQLSDYGKDIDSPADSLNWNFETAESAIMLRYDHQAQTLTILAPEYSGYAELYMTLADDSNATARDTSLIHVKDSETGIDEQGETIVHSYGLDQNYPNPFNPLTTIRFSLKERARVMLEIFDVRARKIAVPLDAEMSAGKHKVTVDGNAMASGIYFYRLMVLQEGRLRYSAIRKMILLK